MPSLDGGDDFLGAFRPDEGLWVEIVVGQEAVNGGLEIDDAFEDAALEPSLGENGEEAFDGIEPGGGCRREVKGEAGVSTEPFDDLGMLVSGIVVEDDVDDFAGWDLDGDLGAERRNPRSEPIESN